MTEMAEASITELRIAPVKSMRSLGGVPALQVDHLGLFGDREYMVIEADTHINAVHKEGSVAAVGQSLTQREDPLLATIVPTLTDQGLTLQHPSADTILVPKAEDACVNHVGASVFGWTGEAVDQGEESAGWLSEVIGRKVRLVAASRQKPRFTEDDPALGQLGFADGYPVTVASAASYDLLNQQLQAMGQPAIPNDRSRTTIVLDDLELPAVELPKNSFPEDYMEAITLIHNGMTLVLKRIKACTRCPIPNTDQITGERTGRPVLAALKEMGRLGLHRDTERYGTKAGVFFSQNFIMELPTNMSADDTITIAKGARVAVEYSAQTNWQPLART